MGKCWISAGRLCWRDIRDAVSLARFEGHDVTLWESSGWIERDFVAKGADAGVRRVHALWRQVTAGDPRTRAPSLPPPDTPVTNA